MKIMHLVSWQGTVVSYETSSKMLVQGAIKPVPLGSLPASLEFTKSAGTNKPSFDHVNLLVEAILAPIGERVSMRMVDGRRRVQLSKGGHYLSAEPSGKLCFDRSEANTWETFLLLSTEELDRIREIVANDYCVEDALTICSGEVRIRSGFVLAFGQFWAGLEGILDQDTPSRLDLSDLRRRVAPFGPSPHPTFCVDKVPKSSARIRVSDDYDATLKSAIRTFHLGNLQTSLMTLLEMKRNYGDSHDLLWYTRQILGRLAEAPPDVAGIVWRGAFSWEGDWLKSLLPRLPILQENECLKKHRLGTIIVVDNFVRAGRAKFYRQAFELGHRIVLFHLSDEHYADDYEIYAWCERVFRNYYSPLMRHQPNVEFFGLGYKSGFERISQPLPVTQRKYRWSFAGDPNKSNRLVMLNEMRKVADGYEHLTSGFGSSDALDVLAYSRLMQTSVFVPCPSGWDNLDSFRVYEALEAGSVPIVERREGFDYFAEAFGGCPFPVLSSWEEAPELIRKLSARGSLDDLVERCFAWWSDYKHTLRQRIHAATYLGSGSGLREHS